jgi:maltose O-acetyltransferase
MVTTANTSEILPKVVRSAPGWVYENQMAPTLIDGDNPRLLHRVLRVSAEDLRWGLRHLWVNTLGGSILVPRLLRYLIYRAAGLDIRTWNIADGCRMRGSAALTIGSGTYVNRECYLEASGPVTIGRDCLLSMQVMIVTSTHALDRDGHVSHTPSHEAVTVGDHCWLGARSTVLPGVAIGDGVVVAAGAVVTEDCEPWGLYAGVPAARVRDLAAQS